uniref:Vitellogenin n=1 Tax=Haemaphysalis flava TaxID=181088 RepID=A0A411G179_HAEFA|nr:vitellogenin [Haemaphysalis flava]
MRVLAALGLLVAAVAAFEVPHAYPKLVFEPRQEYTYRYRSAVSLSVPLKAPHATGEEVYGYLKVIVTAADPVAKTARLFVQLLNVTSAVYDKEVHDHTAPVPGLYHAPLEHFLEHFAKPVVFTVEHLKVVSIEAPEELPEPVVNLYRGLASVLSFSEPLTVPVPFSKVTPVSTEDEVVVYKVFEHDLVGNCETTYHVLSDVHDLSVLNLTKTKNYHKCLGYTAVFHHADYEYQACPQVCPVHKPTLAYEHVEPEYTQYLDPYGAGGLKEDYQKNDFGDSFLTVKYNVSVHEEYGVLESVHAVDKKVLVTGKQQLVATSVMSLELLFKESALRTADVPVTTVKTYNNLTYAYPDQHYVAYGPALELEHLSLWGPIDRKEAMVAVRVLVSRLAELIAFDDLEVKDDYADLIVQLLTVVNALTEEDLYDLLQTVVPLERVNEVSEKEYLERKVLLDGLSLAGTDSAAKTVLRLLFEDKLTLVEALHVLTSLQTSLVKPSTEVLDKLLELCVSEKYVENRLLFSTSCLALAKSVSKHCTKHHVVPVNTEFKRNIMVKNAMKIRSSRQHYSSEEYDEETVPEYKDVPQYDLPVTCTLQDYVKYVKAVVEKLEQAKEFHVVTVLVHTLSKLRHPEALKALVPLALGKHPLCKLTLDTEDESEACQYLRLVTLHSLKHSVITHPAVLQPVLQTVYFDKDEDYELRSVALSLLLLSSPPEPVLARVLLELPREKSLQVAAYTYHTLLAFANHTLPCFKATAYRLKSLLPALERKEFGLHYSSLRILTAYSEETGLGLHGYLGLVQSNTTFLPRSFFTGVEFTKGPYTSPLVEFSVVSKGLLSLQKYLFTEDGPVSLLADAFQRVRRSLGMKLGETYQQLDVLLDMLDQQFNFDTKALLEEPKVVLETTLLGTDLFLPVDKYFVKELLTKGAEYVREKWVHPVNARYVQLRLPFTYRKVVPTVVGYPVALTTRYPTVVSLSLKDFKIRYQPNPKTLLPTLLAVSALVQPTVYTTAVSSAVTVTPFTKLVTAVRVIEKTRFTHPHDLSLQFSSVNHTLAFTFRPRYTKLFTHETKTMTYTTPAFFFTAPQRSVLATMSVLATQSKPFEYKKVFGYKHLGVGLEVTGLTSEPEYNPLYKLNKPKLLLKSLVEAVVNPWAVSRKWEVRVVRNPHAPVDEYKVALRFSTTLNGTDPADYVKEVRPKYRVLPLYPTARHTYPEDLKTPVYEELYEKATGVYPPVLEHHEVLHKVVEATNLVSYPKAENVKPYLVNVTNTTYAVGLEFVVSALGPRAPLAVSGHFVYGVSFDHTFHLSQLYVKKVDSEYETKVHSALLKSPKPSPFKTYAEEREKQYLYATTKAEVFHHVYGPLKYSFELEATPSPVQLEELALLSTEGAVKKYHKTATKKHHYEHDYDVPRSRLYHEKKTTDDDLEYELSRSIIPSKDPTNKREPWPQMRAKRAFVDYDEDVLRKNRPYNQRELPNVGAYSVLPVYLPWYYEKCEEHTLLGQQLTSYACKKTYLHEHRLDKFVVKVTLPTEVPSPLLNVTHKLYQTAKVFFYNKLTTEYVESPVVSKGEFLVEAVLEDLFTGVTVANVTVHTPYYEKAVFTRMPWLKFLRPTVGQSFLSQLATVVKKGYPAPTCLVSPYYLQTFDNVSVPLETLKKDVPYVLLRHAVDEPEFYVLLEQKSEEVQELRVVLKNQTLVKLTPPKDQQTYEVEVNGTLLTVEPLKSHVLQYYFNYTSQVLLYVTAHKNAAPTLWLKVVDSGLVLAYNGSSVIVQVLWPKYNGALSGLCGDNNKEHQHEFVTPEKCVVTEVEDFVNSYSFEYEKTLKGLVFCPLGVTPKVGTPYVSRPQGILSKIRGSKNAKNRRVQMERIPKEEDYLEVFGADVEGLTERRKVIYESGKTCVSTVKFPACKRGYKPSQTEKRDVEFVCFEKEHPKLKKMLKDIQGKRDMTLEVDPTFTKAVDVPVTCVPKKI